MSRGSRGAEAPLLHRIKDAQEAVVAAEERPQKLAREYADASGTAIDRERAQLARRPLYAEGAVLVRLSDQEAKLTRELQAATVAVTEVRAEYKRVYNHHLTQPGGLAS